MQGGTLWTRDISSDVGLAIAGKTLYVTDTDSNVLALDKSSGATIWKNNQLLLRKATAGFPVDDFLILGDYEGYLHVLKSEDGSFVARRKTDGSAIRVSPVTLGDGALIQTSDGGLYSIAIHQ